MGPSLSVQHPDASLWCLFVLQVKKAKKKKPRYPKGWDPSLPNGGMKEPPNPERWLPKWQRSDAKKKQRRRRDRQVGQGEASQWQGLSHYNQRGLLGYSNSSARQLSYCRQQVHNLDALFS